MEKPIPEQESLGKGKKERNFLKRLRRRGGEEGVRKALQQREKVDFSGCGESTGGARLKIGRLCSRFL